MQDIAQCEPELSGHFRVLSLRYAQDKEPEKDRIADVYVVCSIIQATPPLVEQQTMDEE
jgi:hypothetical protein